AVTVREKLAKQHCPQSIEALSVGKQAEVGALLKHEMRLNRYDADTDTLTLTDLRAEAIREVAAHYTSLFGTDPALDELRVQYAMPHGAITSGDDRKAVSGFFFWSAWSAATDRPGETNLSYTSNWPHEPLIDNKPTPGNGLWSMASIILLIAGIAAMVFFHGKQREE